MDRYARDLDDRTSVSECERSARRRSHRPFALLYACTPDVGIYAPDSDLRGRACQPYVRTRGCPSGGSCGQDLDPIPLTLFMLAACFCWWGRGWWRQRFWWRWTAGLAGVGCGARRVSRWRWISARARDRARASREGGKAAWAVTWRRPRRRLRLTELPSGSV